MTPSRRHPLGVLAVLAVFAILWAGCMRWDGKPTPRADNATVDAATVKAPKGEHSIVVSYVNRPCENQNEAIAKDAR